LMRSLADHIDRFTGIEIQDVVFNQDLGESFEWTATVYFSFVNDKGE
jgi:hypothetical protein